MEPNQPSVIDPRAEIDGYLEVLRREPDNESALRHLVRTAQDWIVADGLPATAPAEGQVRAALAGWLAYFAEGEEIVHFGARNGEVANALASLGSTVVSHLDHPGRAMVAAVSFGSEALTFDTIDESAQPPEAMATLVVVETAGLQPVVSLERATAALRAGGWLAVLGSPQLVEVNGLVELGAFRIDRDDRVRPSIMSLDADQISLYRLSHPSTSRLPTLDSLARPKLSTARGQALRETIRRRSDVSPRERAIHEHCSRATTLPIPPQNLINWVGGGDASVFHNIGLINAQQLMIYTRLRPTDKILEPGCGCGRNARALAPFLDHERGEYHGFDIFQKAIDWASENITSVYPNVQFKLADIHNTTYNPTGPIADTEYRFPYADDLFDVVFLPSVFTHMTRPGFEHYAAEIARVLVPGGLLLSWHFLLNDESVRSERGGKSSIPLREFDEVSRVKFPDNPCAAIAFEERYVIEFFESIGLRCQTVIHGHWSGAPASGFEDYQDRILSVKRGPNA